MPAQQSPPVHRRPHPVSCISQHPPLHPSLLYPPPPLDCRPPHIIVGLPLSLHPDRTTRAPCHACPPPPATRHASPSTITLHICTRITLGSVPLRLPYSFTNHPATRRNQRWQRGHGRSAAGDPAARPAFSTCAVAALPAKGRTSHFCDSLRSQLCFTCNGFAGGKLSVLWNGSSMSHTGQYGGGRPRRPATSNIPIAFPCACNLLHASSNHNILHVACQPLQSPQCVALAALSTGEARHGT